jgi:hypothetical protein
VLVESNSSAVSRTPPEEVNSATDFEQRLEKWRKAYESSKVKVFIHVRLEGAVSCRPASLPSLMQAGAGR